jgi:tetratricopeptide (TPR) repeat protein
MMLVAAKTANGMPPGDLAVQLKTASAFHQQGDYAHSIPIFRRIVQEYPRNYDANLLLGEDLLRSGSIQDALVPLRVASEARPKDGTAEAYLAEAAAGLGDFSTASEALQSAVARSDQAEQFLVAWAGYCLDRFRTLGKSLESMKRGEGTELRFEAARRQEGSEARESLLEKSAAIDPEQRGIWGELGLAQLDMGKRSQALESLKQAQLREPEGAETLQLEARLAAMDQHWSDAGGRLSLLGLRSPAELQRALAMWPQRLMPGPEVAGPIWDCLRTKAKSCSLASEQPQGSGSLSARDLYAEGRWEQLAALPPVTSDSSESLWRGIAFVKTGNCPQAIPSLELGLKEDGRAAGFWLEVCYAIEVERVASRLRTKGNEAALVELKGDVMLQFHGDAEAAQKQYAEALKFRPEDPRLREKLAETYMALGDTADARSAALAALALDPRQSSSLQTLAQMSMNDRNYAEAIVQLKRLMMINSKDTWAQVEMGVAYGQLGHPEQAVRYLGPPLAAGYPDDKGGLHALLATALRKLGRETEAKQSAAQAAKLANSSLEGGEHGGTNAPQ